MNHEQFALWHRIRDFEIDAADAANPFSKRLAEEQGWTPTYTARVIEEYRKFAFLSVVAGHGVSPSKPIDGAWHLHLLYTRNYWEQFCPLALGQPLHHNPSNGNLEDDAKYEGWYERTLESYERIFGEPAPEYVWPRRAVPKKKAGWLAALGLAAGGCSQPLNPLDWTGPEFLQLFAGLSIVALIISFFLRERLKGSVYGPPLNEWRLHPYEYALLHGGKERAHQAVILELLVRNMIEYDGKSQLYQAKVDGPVARHPLEAAVMKAVSKGEGAKRADLAQATSFQLSEMEESLQRKKFLTDEATACRFRWAALAVFLPVVLLGVAKVSVGISRERPVMFLVIGLVLLVGIAVAMSISPRVSNYGLALLWENRGGKRTGLDPGVDVSSGVFILASYGVTGLSESYAPHLPALRQPVSSGDGGGSSCGGGGGCGGGGCGGCGS